MSLYIKGLEMPESGEKIIVLTSSGYVEDVSGQVINGAEAFNVPPHGRLGDLDALLEGMNPLAEYENGWMIDGAPTIIPPDDK